ncbi:MAG TPA: HAD family hydrolase [Actinomycetota bacterium]|jgi:HAD superfamily hydrolase (TIGR01549 family)|nr:HAD family hydrolase [Actinomycetota bacterium]
MADRHLAILDIDGTLVDTNYHHALAWYRAFRREGVTIPVWRIHRHMGMGGDHLVAALTTEETEERIGEAVRDAEKEEYQALIDEVAPMPGAADFVRALKNRGHRVVLASSAKADEVEHYLDQLGVRDEVDGWTTSADVEATKPDPDLVTAAMDKVEHARAFMVGDSVYDCEAARRAGVTAIGVLTGGYGAEELERAGAKVVFESILELMERLDDTPLE